MTEIDRRTLFAAAGAVTALAAAPALAKPKRLMVINALGGLSDPNGRLPQPGKAIQMDQNRSYSQRIIDDARAAGVIALNDTLGYVSGPDDPFESTVKDIARTDARIRSRPADLIKILSVADILRARDENKVGMFYGFQNTTMIGDKIERVQLFHDLGVRVVQLTYNLANSVGDGSMAPENRGLTPWGRQLVGALNDAKLMVDLSHSGEQTCLEAARISKAPISINHTGCRALTDLPRNKTDAELRLVAERGGFVGIYFMPYLNPTSVATAADVVAHIDHAVNICGEDAVGIGTDGGITGIDDMPAYRAIVREEIAARKAAGIGAKGENPDTVPFVADLIGPDQFHKLAGLLKAKGYKDARIDKIMSANFLRYGQLIWGG